MESRDLIRILKEVPEYRLRIIQLASEVIDGDGKIDPQKLSFLRKEVEEAVDEARAYVQATKEAVLCLIKMDHS